MQSTNERTDHTEVGPQSHGAVVWLTGRPSSGKTTLAGAVRRELVRRGYSCVVLDGDSVRDAIVPPHGYTAEGRDAFYATLARLAAMLCAQGVVVVVAATGHRSAYRAEARSLANAFLEVYVDTPADEPGCRDDKGLNARARAGETQGPPGGDFEAPENPDLIAHGGHDRAALARVIELVARTTG